MNIYTHVKNGFFKVLAIDHRRMHPVAGFFFSKLKLLLFTTRKFHQDNGFLRSSTLAYSMLLALLPMTLILIVAVNAFGGLEDLQGYVTDFIRTRLLPEHLAEAADYLIDSANKTMTSFQASLSSNTALYAFLSFLIFVVTVVFFFNAIEVNLNAMWGAKRTRGIVSRFKNFWCVMTIGPIFFFLSYYVSYSTRPGTVFAGVMAFVLPYLLVILALFFLYMLIPYTSIRPGSALLGAAVAGIVWVILKDQFNSFAEGSFKQEAYNFLWIIPVFLVWLYFTWVIVLFGMELVFCGQNFDFLDSGYMSRETDEGFSREYLAMGLVVAVYEAFEDGAPPPRFSRVAKMFSVPEHNLFEVAEDLENAKIIEHPGGGLLFRPCRPIEKVTVADVVSAVRGDTLSVPPGVDGPFASRMRELFGGARTAAEEHLKVTTMRDLIKIKDSQNGHHAADD